MDYTLWKRLQYIVRNGNESVHTEKSLDREDAVLSLNILFDFVEWIDYCYGRDYIERNFDETKIPNITKMWILFRSSIKRLLKMFKKNADKIVDEKIKKLKDFSSSTKTFDQEMEIKKNKMLMSRSIPMLLICPEWLTRKKIYRCRLLKQMDICI